MVEHPREYQKMAQAELSLWWYAALHQLTARALASHPCGLGTRVLDAGCGTGGLLMFLQQKSYRNLSGFDVSPHAVRICRARGLPVQAGNLCELDHLAENETVEALISNDTLYFFPPDEQVKILRRCWQTLAHGGLLILNLPAISAFRGIHDLSVGIQHRFTKADIPHLLHTQQFEIIQARYWPFLLSPVIYLARLKQRMRLQFASRCELTSDLSLSPPWCNRFLTGIMRLELALPPWGPFGSSLFLVARKR